MCPRKLHANSLVRRQVTNIHRNLIGYTYNKLNVSLSVILSNKRYCAALPVIYQEWVDSYNSYYPAPQVISCDGLILTTTPRKAPNIRDAVVEPFSVLRITRSGKYYESMYDPANLAEDFKSTTKLGVISNITLSAIASSRLSMQQMLLIGDAVCLIESETSGLIQRSLSNDATPFTIGTPEQSQYNGIRSREDNELLVETNAVQTEALVQFIKNNWELDLVTELK